jgi:hypothetical protein
MAFYTGTGSRLQIGKEASFAQAASPTTLVDLTSESIKVAVEKGDEGSLLGSKTASSRDLLAVTVEGSVSFILRPESAGLILHATLGGDDTCSQVGDSDSYTHTMGLCDVNEALPSLTIAVDRKAAIKRYVGCTISALSLDCAAGDYVKGSIDLKGTTEESGTIDEALKSFSIPSYRCTNATFTVNGSTYDITSASLKIDNALESSPRRTTAAWKESCDHQFRDPLQHRGGIAEKWIPHQRGKRVGRVDLLISYSRTQHHRNPFSCGDQ